MQRLILLCIQLIKFRTNHALFGHAIDLLIETFKTSNKLTAIQRTSPKGLSKNIDEHVSSTIPALESLIGIFTIGAYIAKRRRFDYLPFLLRQDVAIAGFDYPDESVRKSITMWPLRIGWGEPEVLQRRGGKINLVLSRILLDPAILQLFGSEEEALRALIGYEFLVEFNSHLGIEQELSPETCKYMQAKYAGVNFAYHADFIAFDLGYVAEMASEVFSRLQSVEQLTPMVWDPLEARIFASDLGRLSYLQFLKAVQEAHATLSMELNRFPSYTHWPKPLQEAMNALPPREPSQ